MRPSLADTTAYTASVVNSVRLDDGDGDTQHGDAEVARITPADADMDGTKGHQVTLARR